MRAVIDSLLPPGALWHPKPDAGFDQDLDGLTDSLDEGGRALADTLADIRNPDKTPVFTDLERNYGIQPNENISNTIRVARLKQKVYQGEKVNSIEDLQAELDTAGFDLQVHKNDPPVDPATFLTKSFQITAGSDYAYAGFNLGADVLAFAASLGGELLVNTPLGQQAPSYLMQAGGSVAYAGYTSDGINSEAVAGYYLELRRALYEYPVPTNPDYWPMIFFVGGDATRNAAGELIKIESGLVQNNRRDDLQSIILADKTCGAWCGLVITFT